MSCETEGDDATRDQWYDLQSWQYSVVRATATTAIATLILIIMMIV